MENIEINYSQKNIPIPTTTALKKKMIQQTEKFITSLRWKLYHYLNKNSKSNIETFGFKTPNSAPPNEKLAKFEKELFDLIGNLQFDRSLNKFQQKLRSDITLINQSEEILIHADKTSNIYTIPKNTYSKLLRENITDKYKTANSNIIGKINNEAKTITENLEIDDRVEIIAPRQAYITVKDHKPGFPNNPKCRLINPAKSEIGIISKQFLEEINKNIRASTKLNQWQNTAEVIDWFTGIKDKQQSKFLKFDIIDFYPSITPELLEKAINFASTITKITDETKQTILHARKSLLFHNNKVWRKRENADFDVTMGGFDGAEVSELVGLYLLHRLDPLLGKQAVGLYRDDGIACLNKISGPNTDKLRKSIIKIFKEFDMKITIETNLKIADFLDVTLDLNNDSYYPFKKANSKLLYVNTQSNHPPSVIKQIPKMVATRLSDLSSNSTAFNHAKTDYEDALKKSGHNEQLQFTQKTEPAKKKRKRKVTWFNPPYSSNLKTNLGKEFFKLLDKNFPKESPLHRLFNRNNVKLSYSCMPNMSAIIAKHNMKILNEPDTQSNSKSCNCRDRKNCPLGEKCLTKSIIYKATVKTNSDEKFYIGCSETEFKTRFNNHKQSFKSPNMANCTELSKYIWSLKEKNKQYSVVWNIAANAKPYNCGTRKCDLCLTEKLLILESDPGKILNTRAEILAKCRHQNKYKLKNFNANTPSGPFI